MGFKCWWFDHDWGPKTPWHQFTQNQEVPYDGDFLVRICKRCDVMMEVPGSHLGHGKMYVRNEDWGK